MRALLTGSTGFVGQNLFNYFKMQGWDLETIGRQDTVAEMDSKMLNFKPEVVIHLATMFRAEHKAAEIEDIIQSNITFGTQVLESVVRHGVKNFINTGTLWQYYEGNRQVPSSLYSATKSAFESILRFYVSASSLQVMNLMLSDTFGPKDPRGKLLSKLISMAGTNETLQLSPGEQKVEWTYIDDVVRAYEVAAQRMLLGLELGKFTHYTVTSGEAHSLKDTVDICESVLGQKIDVRFGAKPYRQREIMSPAKLDPVLPGWSPQVSLREGIKACRHV